MSERPMTILPSSLPSPRTRWAGRLGCRAIEATHCTASGPGAQRRTELVVASASMTSSGARLPPSYSPELLLSPDLAASVVLSGSTGRSDERLAEPFEERFEERPSLVRRAFAGAVLMRRPYPCDRYHMRYITRIGVSLSPDRLGDRARRPAGSHPSRRGRVVDRRRLGGRGLGPGSRTGRAEGARRRRRPARDPVRHAAHRGRPAQRETD